MAKPQLKDFLMGYLLNELLPRLIWWEDIDECIFKVKLADGRKNRNNECVAILTKDWETVNGRDSRSNSKMNFKEALKRSPYIKTISIDKSSGVHTLQFVEKGFKKQKLQSIESYPLDAEPANVNIAQVTSEIVTTLMNNPHFHGQRFTISVSAGEDGTLICKLTATSSDTMDLDEPDLSDQQSSPEAVEMDETVDDSLSSSPESSYFSKNDGASHIDHQYSALPDSHELEPPPMCSQNSENIVKSELYIDDILKLCDLEDSATLGSEWQEFLLDSLGGCSSLEDTSHEMNI